MVQAEKVREWPKKILSITTTPSTSIVKRKYREFEIKPKRTNLLFCTFSTHNVGSHQRIWKVNYLHVTLHVTSTNDISRWNRNQVYFETYIQKSISTCSYSLQLIQYFQIKEKSIPQDPSCLVLEIFSDKFTGIVVHSASE